MTSPSFEQIEPPAASLSKLRLPLYHKTAMIASGQASPRSSDPSGAEAIPRPLAYTARRRRHKAGYRTPPGRAAPETKMALDRPPIIVALRSDGAPQAPFSWGDRIPQALATTTARTRGRTRSGTARHARRARLVACSPLDQERKAAHGKQMVQVEEPGGMASVPHSSAPVVPRRRGTEESEIGSSSLFRCHLT